MQPKANLIKLHTKIDTKIDLFTDTAAILN